MPFGTDKIGVENWDSYLDPDNKPFLKGYLEANIDLIKDLSEILSKELDFKKTKKEILKFYNERKEFINYAAKNPCSP